FVSGQSSNGSGSCARGRGAASVGASWLTPIVPNSSIESRAAAESRESTAARDSDSGAVVSTGASLCGSAGEAPSGGGEGSEKAGAGRLDTGGGAAALRSNF